nr:ABC transporter permease [Halobellus rarus]
MRQRLRSPRYLVVPLLIAWVAQTLTSETTHLVVAGEYTGIRNAAWFGGMVATMGTFLLFVFGFALVRGAVTRDRETRVGELVATSPVRDATYLVGRWLGYIALLSLVTALLVLATVGGYALHGTGTFDLWALASPFVFLTLPAMALVAAAAVLAETVRPLRGTLGSVCYFFGAIALFTAASLATSLTYGPTGLAVIRNSMVRAASADPTAFESRSFAFTDDPGSVTTFVWQGVDWGLTELLSRAPTLAAAGLTLAVAIVAFDRFEPSPGLTDRLAGVLTDDDSSQDDAASASDATEAGHRYTTPPSDVDLTSVTPASSGVPNLRVLTAELRLALRGRRWWWYLAVGSCVVGGLLAPIDAARGLVLPGAWLLGLPVWSELGVREQRYRTAELVFTAPHPHGQLAAVYLGGVAVAIVAAGGVLVTLATSGALAALGAVLVGALFVPALGLASGIWLGTPRAFEVVFLTLWYLGPMNAVYTLDFVGAHPETIARGTPLGVAAAAVMLLIAAVIGRSRQIGQ